MKRQQALRVTFLRSRFPSRDDAANFLYLMHKVFMVCNAKAETHGSDSFGESAKIGGGKVDLYLLGSKNGVRVPTFH